MADTYNPVNWYWDVLDTNHGTHVFSSASGSFVVVADATYQAWLTAGNVPTIIPTKVDLDGELNKEALNNLPKLWGSQSTSGSGSINLTNPRLILTTITVTSGTVGFVTLPQANMPNSIPIGVPFYIRNAPASTGTLAFLPFGGGTGFGLVNPGDEARIIKTSNATVGGTYDISVSPSLPVKTTDGGTNWNGALTTNGILLGNNNGSIKITAAMTDGQLLIGQTGAAPLPKTISGAITIDKDGVVTLSGSLSDIAYTPSGGISSTTVKTAIAELDTEKAPLASPVLTGNPQAPTPSAGDSDTSIATTAYVRGEINALIGAAPGALDTLDELANALADNTNYSVTITNLLALKAPLDSPALTGTPSAPTPTVGDNSTKIATTAFVEARIVPRARVYNSAALSIPNGLVTALTFNSERYDTDNIHSTSSNTSRLTATTAGTYLIIANVSFASNTTGERVCRIRLNGTTTIGNVAAAPVTGDSTTQSVSTQYALAAGDYVEVEAFQTSGGALNVEANANYSPEFSMIRLAP